MITVTSIIRQIRVNGEWWVNLPELLELLEKVSNHGTCYMNPKELAKELDKDITTYPVEIEIDA